MTDHDDKTPDDDGREISRAPGDFSDLTPAQHENVEYDVNVAMENIAARPGLKVVGEMVKAVVEDAFSAAKQGRRVPSCLHAVDQSYMPGIGYLPIGKGQESERTIYLCTQHPQRLMCDNPASRSGPGCFEYHFATEHEAETHGVNCFVCEKSIPFDQWTAVSAVIELDTPIQVFDMHDRAFMYQGFIETLPITYLCLRHAGAVDLPLRVKWHLPR